MDCPWSPESNYSEAESTFGQQKPGTYLIVKMTNNGGFDYSSSTKEVLKLIPDKVKTELEGTLKIAHQRSNPDQNNHYAQMLKETDALYSRDPNQEDVKDLRHFIPLFRKVDYLPKEDIEKKFKLKSMWSEKPYDWPRDVPHVDPNNTGIGFGGKKNPKPKKPELVKMFQHLAKKYGEIRDGLWMDNFGYHPDLGPAENEITMESNHGKDNGLRALADQVIHIYGDGQIEKLINALLKAFDYTNPEDKAAWVKGNRQKSVLEADLKECIYLAGRDEPHGASDVMKELKDICQNINIDPEDVLSVPVHAEEVIPQLPLVVEEARSPTGTQPRKRKPTVNMEMDGYEANTPGTVMAYAHDTQDNMIPAVSPADDMEVGRYEDVISDGNIVLLLLPDGKNEIVRTNGQDMTFDDPTKEHPQSDFHLDAFRDEPDPGNPLDVRWDQMGPTKTDKETPKTALNFFQEITDTTSNNMQETQSYQVTSPGINQLPILDPNYDWVAKLQDLNEFILNDVNLQAGTY